MAVTAAQRESITRFRERLESELRGDPRVRAVSREDRADESTLASRFQVADRVWLELALRPAIPQLRAGIMTDDRWLSEELEEAIEETGDTMSEFIEFGFESVGLSWPEPPVEHYRDQGKYFYFATAQELRDLSQLADESLYTRARRMLDGYYEAFRAKIERLNAAAGK